MISTGYHNTNTIKDPEVRRESRSTWEWTPLNILYVGKRNRKMDGFWVFSAVPICCVQFNHEI